MRWPGVTVVPTRKATAPRRPADGPAPTRRARLILVGAAVLSAAILAGWFPASALLRQRTDLASATTELHQLHGQDAALAQERKNLSSSAEIARIAREQYQLVNPGQSAYQVLPPPGTAAGISASDPGATAPVAPSASVELPPGGTAGTATSGGSSQGKSGAGSSTSLVSRMLHALEFWR